MPFRDVYIHGLVRDEKGEKMSKSKGNVVDPLVLMDKYGTDALRFTLASMTVQGGDIKLRREPHRGNRNFANKLWNAARFILTQTEGIPLADAKPGKSLADRWIVSRLQSRPPTTRKA